MILKNTLIIVFILAAWFMTSCEIHTTGSFDLPEVTDFQFSVTENAPASTLVGEIRANGAESEGLNYYLITSEYSTAFKLDSANGLLTVRDPEVLDYESLQSIELDILVKKSIQGAEYGNRAKVTITLLDAVETAIWVSDNQSLKNQSAVINSLFSDSVCQISNILMASAWTVNFQPVVYRSVFRFDFSGFPADAAISAARLSLFNPGESLTGSDHSSFSGSNRFVLCRVSEDWNPTTVTWKNQPSSSTASQVDIPGTESSYQDYLDIDVTELVKDMVQNPSANYGFLLRLEDESYYRRICFSSFACQIEEKMPKLVIEYKY